MGSARRSRRRCRSRVGAPRELEPDEFPFISIVPGTPVALLTSVNGVQNEMKVWTAPVSEAANPNAHWTLLFDRSADINSVDQHGDEIFLRSHKTRRLSRCSCSRPASR